MTRKKKSSQSEKFLPAFSWMFVDALFAIANGLIFSAWVARHLGPEQMGYVSTMYSIGAFLLSVNELGFDKIITRRISEGSPNAFRVAFTLRLALAVLISTSGLAFYFFSKGENNLYAWGALVCAFFSLAAVFNVGFSVLDAFGKFKLTAIARIIAYSFSMLARGILVYAGAGLLAFAFLQPIYLALAGVLALVFALKNTSGIFKKYPSQRHAYTDGNEAKILLWEGAPMLLSLSLASLNAHVGIVLTQAMSSSAEASFYYVGSRIISLSFFVPHIVGRYFYPLLASNRKLGSDANFKKQLMRFFQINGAIMIVVFLGAFLVAPELIKLLFGDQYLEALNVLRIQAFALIFIFFNAARMQILVIDARQGVNVSCTFIGAIANLILCVYLIPSYGSIGASWAFVFGQAAQWFIGAAFFKFLRPLFVKQTLACVMFYKVLNELRK